MLLWKHSRPHTGPKPGVSPDLVSRPWSQFSCSQYFVPTSWIRTKGDLVFTVQTPKLWTEAAESLTHQSKVLFFYAVDFFYSNSISYLILSLSIWLFSFFFSCWCHLFLCQHCLLCNYCVIEIKFIIIFYYYTYSAKELIRDLTNVRRVHSLNNRKT